jgi:hypothetical protein
MRATTARRVPELNAAKCRETHRLLGDTAHRRCGKQQTDPCGVSICNVNAPSWWRATAGALP